MVPDTVMVLDEMPLNASGKGRPQGAPGAGLRHGTVEFVAPRTPLEEIVAGIFGDVLGVDAGERRRSFFDLGGNSLGATRVVARVSSGDRHRVGIRDCSRPRRSPASRSSSSDRARRTRPPGTRRAAAAPERFPLSLAQQRMWFLNRFDSVVAGVQRSAHRAAAGELDVDALAAALLRRRRAARGAAHRVPGLRFRSAPGDPARRRRRPRSRAGRRPRGGPAAPDRSSSVRTGFDVTARVPVRARLFRLGATTTSWCWCAPHRVRRRVDGAAGPRRHDRLRGPAATGRSPRGRRCPSSTRTTRCGSGTCSVSEDDPDPWPRRRSTSGRRPSRGARRARPAHRPAPSRRCSRWQVPPSASPSTRTCTVALGEVARAHDASLFMVLHAGRCPCCWPGSFEHRHRHRHPGGGSRRAGARRPRRHVRQHAGAADRGRPGTSFAELLEQVRTQDLAAFPDAWSRMET